MIKFFIMLACICLTIGCSAPAGEPGKSGENGKVGSIGEKGEPGQNGDAGDIGAQGQKGDTGDKMLSSIFCSGFLEGTDGLGFTYNAIKFANNNLLVNASIKDGYVEAYASRTYTDAQNGWLTGDVNIQHDIYTPTDGGFWSLSLNRLSLIVSIQYNDTDLANGIKSWTMTSHKCILTDY